jgi:trk system potassium uptake protein
MYYVVVSAGRFGYYLTKLLLEEEHEVVVIEKDEKLAQKIANDFDIVVLIDDPTKRSVLEQANVRSADALIALTDEDEVNIMICILAKELGAKKVAVRLSKVSYHQEFLTKLGIDVAFHPEVAAVSYIEQMLTKPDVLDLAFLSKGEAEIIEFKVTKESKILNKKVSNLTTDKTGVVAIFDIKNKLLIPKPDTILKEGFKVLYLAQTNEAKKIKEKLVR